MEIKPFDPTTLFLIALFNPAVIAVAVVMGRRADQWQKIFVAAFAASLAGVALYWLLGEVGLLSIHALGGEVGLLLLQFLFGVGWAALGFALRR